MSFLFFFLSVVALLIFYVFVDIFRGIKYILAYVVILSAFYGAARFFTEKNIGAESLEHDDGLSIRQDSANTVGRKSLFIYYNTNRAHMGGGMRAGK